MDRVLHSAILHWSAFEPSEISPLVIHSFLSSKDLTSSLAFKQSLSQRSGSARVLATVCCFFCVKSAIEWCVVFLC